MKKMKICTKTNILIVLCMILVVGLIGFISVRSDLFDKNNHAIISGDLFPGSGDAVKGHLPKMSEDEILAQMQKKADESVFSFKINPQPVFLHGSSEGTLNIENPGHNIYPFVVKILLDDTGEIIYDSGGILPDHHISTAKLTKVLPQGTYAATAYIHVYDPETSQYNGKSAVELTIIVKM